MAKQGKYTKQTATTSKADRWSRFEGKLPENHGWVSKPGYKIFVANRGEVRFDFPENWIVKPGDDSIRFTDREPPDDECCLQISVQHLPPGIDFSGLPVRALLQALGDENDAERRTIGRGELISVKRPDMDLCWFEQRVLDLKQDNREAISRVCLARAKTIQPLITFDFWPEHLPHLDPVWREVLRSLQIGNMIADPTKHFMH